MAQLTEAEMEARYDAERSGAAYSKSACPDCGSPAATARAVYCDSCGRILLDDMSTILEEMDGGEGEPEDTDKIIGLLEDVEAHYDQRAIDHRFDRVIDAVCDLPNEQRQIAVALWEGFLAGVSIGTALQTAPLGAA